MHKLVEKEIYVWECYECGGGEKCQLQSITKTSGGENEHPRKSYCPWHHAEPKWHKIGSGEFYG